MLDGCKAARQKPGSFHKGIEPAIGTLDIVTAWDIGLDLDGGCKGLASRDLAAAESERASPPAQRAGITSDQEQSAPPLSISSWGVM